MNEMLQKLRSVVDESGLWRGDRAESHKILLSPSVYRITESQRCELAGLGVALRECLKGLSHIAVIVHNSEPNHRGTWLKIRRVFTTGVPSVYHEFQGMRIRDIPRLLKLDLMVDVNGQFKIAEIDGHNKHGIGYSTLGMKFRDALYPGSVTLPGVAKLIAEDAKLMKQKEVKIFYADQERFYIPEFEIARNEISKHGVNCSLFSEMESRACSEILSGFFLDLPFLYKKPEFYRIIGNSYRSGAVRFIIPPKPFLGAKGVLALLRNDDKDAKLEAILHSFIEAEFLELVRRFIPYTLLLGKEASRLNPVNVQMCNKRFILKESVSSGMKGIVFSTDGDYNKTLERACASKMNWILQEEIVNQPQQFSWFDGVNGTELRTSDDWFMRVTAHYVNGTLGDLIVTARRDKAVHGGKDCLQLGTIIV